MELQELQKFLKYTFRLNNRFIASRHHYSWFKNHNYQREYNAIFQFTKYADEQFKCIQKDQSIKQRALDILSNELYQHKCDCRKASKNQKKYIF